MYGQAAIRGVADDVRGVRAGVACLQSLNAVILGGVVDHDDLRRMPGFDDGRRTVAKPGTGIEIYNDDGYGFHVVDRFENRADGFT